MIFSSPPQFGQCSRSSYNRRLSKRAALTLARWLTHPSAAGGGRLLMAGSVRPMSGEADIALQR